MHECLSTSERTYFAGYDLKYVTKSIALPCLGRVTSFIENKNLSSNIQRLYRENIFYTFPPRLLHLLGASEDVFFFHRFKESKIRENSRIFRINFVAL